MPRLAKEKKLPDSFKESDIPQIIKFLETKTGPDVARLYGLTTEVFKKNVGILRDMGYPIPRVSYKESKTKVQKRISKPEQKKLPNRVIDESLLKWVRIDKRTIIQVPIGISEELAIEQYYARKERVNEFRK